MSIPAIALSQVLLTLHPEGAGPLRFGFPMPETALQRGLRLTGPPGASLQWRSLQRRSDRLTKRVWIELAIDGVSKSSGAMRIFAGGRAAMDVDAAIDSGRPVVRREALVEEVDGRREETVTWKWRSGVEDKVKFITFESAQEFGAAQEFEAEFFSATERLSLGVDPRRFLRAGIRPAVWRKVGVLPRGGRIGRHARRRLLDIVPRLREMKGMRGRGDYRRSGEVVTNLEFDTTLAFARLGLAEGVPSLVARALRSAIHSADHDLDGKTSLLFRHGKDHRQAAPDVGHTWLSGLLLVGCLAADESLIFAARRIARGLARHPATGQGRDDMIRDAGWPLAEMEAWLRFDDDPEVAAAAASLVSRVRRRYDPRHKIFRFGEGEKRSGVYEEPLWVTAGSLMPGLRAYAARTGDKRIQKLIREVEREMSKLIRNGKPGLPVRAWYARGEVVSQARVSGTPGCYMLLDGLSPGEFVRVMRRGSVIDALADVPAFDDVDLVTSFSIVGRCAWIYR